MDRYAVVGHPVAHSKSPFIHKRFASQSNAELTYDIIDVESDGFEAVVNDFFDAGGKGLNITVPHKERAWEMSQWRSDGAERSGAVNTLYRDEDGRLCGHNTDGIGLVRDIIQNHDGEIKGKRVLLLGAGGAARGVMPALLSRSPAQISIANRTVTRAQALVEHFTGAIPLTASSFSGLAGDQFDLVINGTSAGLKGELPVLPDGLLAPDAWCYDMVYGRGETAFQHWARAHGAGHALDGCGMLVEQAAQAFYIWRGVMPATARVITELRQSLS